MLRARQRRAPRLGQRDVAQGSTQEESAPDDWRVRLHDSAARHGGENFEAVPLCGFGVWHGEPVPPAGTDAQSAGKRPSGGGGGGAEHDCRGSARAAPAP